MSYRLNLGTEFSNSPIYWQNFIKRLDSDPSLWLRSSIIANELVKYNVSYHVGKYLGDYDYLIFDTEEDATRFKLMVG